MRILTDADKEAVIKYVGKEPEMNLFIIGDVENYGTNSGPVNIYVQDAPGGGWDFLILRFYDNYILYSQEESFDHESAAGFLIDKKPECISGKLSLISKLTPYFPAFSVQSTFMSRCNRVKSSFQAPPELDLRLLTHEDIPDSIDLYLEIEEFSKTYRGKREKSILTAQEELANGGKTIMGGYINGKLAAIAGTSAENSASAMIIGVATAPEQRGRGYASAVVSSLCNTVLSGGRQFLCLFYENPAAGRIYHRLGFEEIGEYAMLR